MNVIRTKWMFRNKLDESGVITRNKTMLVAKVYNQEEGNYAIYYNNKSIMSIVYNP